MNKEHRKHISEALLGKTKRPHTEDEKKHLSKVLLGHTVAEKTRKKMSESKAGLALSSGTAVYNKDKHRFLSSYEYLKLRRSIRLRDGNSCIRCKGARKSKIVCHHLVPTNIGKKFRSCDNASNMVTLCYHCHGDVHGNKKSDDWKLFLLEAKAYLSQFGYEQFLLDKYI